MAGNVNSIVRRGSWTPLFEEEGVPVGEVEMGWMLSKSGLEGVRSGAIRSGEDSRKNWTF
jgi:hypothetical protein